MDHAHAFNVIWQLLRNFFEFTASPSPRRESLLKTLFIPYSRMKQAEQRQFIQLSLQFLLIQNPYFPYEDIVVV